MSHEAVPFGQNGLQKGVQSFRAGHRFLQLLAPILGRIESRTLPLATVVYQVQTPVKFALSPPSEDSVEICTFRCLRIAAASVADTFKRTQYSLS